MNAPQKIVVAATEITLNATVERYLADYQGRDESRYQRITTWLRLLDGNQPLIAITPEDIDAGMDKLANESARVYGGKDADGSPIFRAKQGRRSGATLNRYLIALAALFAWARRERLVPRGFDVPTKYVEKNKESRGRVRYLSDGERDRLLAACRESAWPRLYLFVLMGLTTGGRRGELLALRWCDLDFERGEAELHDTKNGDRRILVLLPQVIEELDKFAPKKDAHKSEMLIFRSRLRPTQPYSTAKAFNEAVELARIKDFRFHDCRHCTASYMAQQGASLLEIADTLGHRQLRMVQRYAHLNTDSRRRLMTRVFEGRI